MDSKIIKENLLLGHKVRVKGFGTFVIRNRKSRVGRNPATNHTMEVPEMSIIGFIPSIKLRKDIQKVSANVKRRHSD